MSNRISVLALMLVFIVFAAPTYAACSAATIAGEYGGTVSGANFFDGYPYVGIGRAKFDGIKTITVLSYKEGAFGETLTFNGSGTYSLAANCQGIGTINLKQDGVSVGQVKFDFVVMGTPSNPQIAVLTRNPNNASSGLIFLGKIDF